MARSAVAVGGGQGEGIGQMPDFVDAVMGEQDLDDVEAEFDLGILDSAQVIERGAGESSLTFAIDGFRRSCPVLVRTGFDFDEGEAIMVADDQIDFAVAGAKVGGEEFQSVLFEVGAGGLFTELAAAEMDRSGFPVKECQESGPEWHGGTAQAG